MNNKDNKRITEEIKSMGKTVVNGINKGYNYVKDKTKSAYESIKDRHEFKKAFNTSTDEFEVVGIFNLINQPVKIRAFIINNNEILFKSDDNDIKRILSGTILKKVKDDTMIQINTIDIKTQVNYTISVLDEEVLVPCFKAVYKVYNKNHLEEEKPTIDINRINELTLRLDTLENTLKNAKPGLFGKGKLQQQKAINLYPSFKDCVLNQHKDEQIVNEFIELAKPLIPNVEEVVNILFN